MSKSLIQRYNEKNSLLTEQNLKSIEFSRKRNLTEEKPLDIDENTVNLRKRRRLRRRSYANPGPNFRWHIDGYDKLKPHGFPIHGAIDGFSRKIIWLKWVRLTKTLTLLRIISFEQSSTLKRFHALQGEVEVLKTSILQGYNDF